MGLVGEQNLKNHIGVRINPNDYSRPQVQDTECSGYRTDAVLCLQAVSSTEAGRHS